MNLNQIVKVLDALEANRQKVLRKRNENLMTPIDMEQEQGMMEQGQEASQMQPSQEYDFTHSTNSHHPYWIPNNRGK